MAHEAENTSPTSQVEESDPDALLSPPPDARPEPGLNGKPVRCEWLCFFAVTHNLSVQLHRV